MRNFKSFHFTVAAATAMGLSLTACGDDVTEVTEVHKDGMAVLEKGEDLSEQACDTTNVGEMLFVMDSSEAFICDGESWQTLKGEKGETGADGKDGSDGTDGTSCTVKSVKNKDDLNGLEVTCGKTVVDTIWNGAAGKDGKPGNPGKDGENGTGCTAKSVENDAGLKGFELTCGETVVGTIWDGQKGGDGEKGNDGVGCSLTDDGQGSVAVTCGDEDPVTIYKAVCGTKPYDPGKAFCSEGELFDLCDGKPYDPKTRYCLKVTRDETDIYSLEDILTDSRDNQVYKTVKINDQVWMAENLNYADSAKTPSLKGKSWCGGGRGTTEGDCSVYGRLYTWAAAIDSVALANDADDPQTCGIYRTCKLPPVVQGVCPEGWHLPSIDEWNALITAVGGTEKAGQKLQAKSDLWISNDGISNDDSYGFSALPAGYRFNEGDFYSEGYEADFWSASENNGGRAEYLYLYYSDDFASLSNYGKGSAFSVRCIKD